MSACMCDSRTCELFGCQQDARDRARLNPFQERLLPVRPPPTGRPREVRIFSEAEIRSIVREELERAAQGKQEGSGK